MREFKLVRPPGATSAESSWVRSRRRRGVLFDPQRAARASPTDARHPGGRGRRRRWRVGDCGRALPPRWSAWMASGCVVNSRTAPQLRPASRTWIRACCGAGGPKGGRRLAETPRGRGGLHCADVGGAGDVANV